MEIVDVRVRSFKLPPPKVLREPFYNSILFNSPPKDRWASVTQITTDEGLAGFWPGGNKETIEQRIRPKLIGEDPLRPERLWHKMYMGGDRKPIARGDYIVAMSHVDNALWDLVGKTLDQPVYKLLGGYDNRVRVYAAGGYYAKGKTKEDLIKEMESNVAEGFTAVKMKVGGWRFGITMEADVERVRAVREALGNEIDIMVDANNAWNAYEARRFAKLVEPYHPFWFEEPVLPDDLDGSLELKASTDIPIASGENEFTHYGFRDLIAKRAVDIIQADPDVAGGLTEIRKIAAMADAFHMHFAPHGGHIIGSHAVAAFSNGLIVECYTSKASPYRDSDPCPDIYTSDLKVKDGSIEIPDKPGFGMKIDEKIAAKYELKDPKQ